MTMGFYIEGLTWLDSRGIACSVLRIVYCVTAGWRFLSFPKVLFGEGNNT